jgi:glycosyltransferase involved in cell wall biosynthesis
MPDPLVSVVVCTYRRFELLGMAVASLAQQTASPEDYEVIVVDNDTSPNRAVQDVVDQYAKEIHIKYMHEPRIGLSYARNTGGKSSQAAYIGYMDDDAKAPRHYIAELLQVVNQQAPQVCGGPFYPFYLTSKPAWFKDAYGTGSCGDAPRHLTRHESLYGGNIIFQAKLLEEVGWFDPQFGMAGSKIGYGEETAVQMALWKRCPDLQVYYDPELFVYHLVPGRKMTLSWRLKAAYQMGKTQGFLWMSPEELAAARKRAGWMLLYSTARLLRTVLTTPFRDRSQFPYWQNYAYEAWAKKFTESGNQVRLNAQH